MLRAITRQLVASAQLPAPAGASSEAAATDVTAVAPPSAWHEVPMFQPAAGRGLSFEQREELDSNGHIVLPAALTPETTQRCIQALACLVPPCYVGADHEEGVLAMLRLARLQTRRS